MIRPVALVTGGARRIGAAIVRQLAAEGFAVVIHANRSMVEAQALAVEIAVSGGQASVLQGDLADLGQIDALMMRACLPFGAPGLLVNNASRFDADAFGNLESAVMSGNLAVNLQAPILLAQAFAARLPTEAPGAIVNIIDQRVLRPNPQLFSYALAKSGLHWTTMTMAQALAPRIRVNAVGPGPTFPNPQDGDLGLEQEATGTLLAKPVDAAAIAEAVLYLARAEYVTGQLIAVDSGQHLGWKTPDIVQS